MGVQRQLTGYKNSICSALGFTTKMRNNVYQDNDNVVDVHMLVNVSTGESFVDTEKCLCQNMR